MSTLTPERNEQIAAVERLADKRHARLMASGHCESVAAWWGNRRRIIFISKIRQLGMTRTVFRETMGFDMFEGEAEQLWDYDGLKSATIIKGKTVTRVDDLSAAAVSAKGE